MSTDRPEPDLLDDDLPEEELDAELDHDDPRLRDELRQLLDPGTDLQRRASDDIDRTLRGRSFLTTGLDLIGLGWWTAKEMLRDDRPHADGEVEDDDG